jgi:hypothetical protein
MTPEQRDALEKMHEFGGPEDGAFNKAEAMALRAGLDDIDSLTARLAREIQSHGISVKTQMELGARMVAAEARLAEVSLLCREVATGSTLSDFSWLIQRAAEGKP